MICWPFLPFANFLRTSFHVQSLNITITRIILSEMKRKFKQCNWIRMCRYARDWLIKMPSAWTFQLFHTSEASINYKFLLGKIRIAGFHNPLCIICLFPFELIKYTKLFPSHLPVFQIHMNKSDDTRIQNELAKYPKLHW